jgi:hypothetical protein
MEIRCPTCGARVPATDVNVERMIAKCLPCDSVFDFSSQVAPAPAEGRQRRRPRVGLPPKMVVELDAPASATAPTYRRPEGTARGAIVVRWRWFEPAKHLFMAVFCVAWDAFLVFWYGVAFTGLSQSRGGDGGFWLMVLFPIVHVAVGVSLTYGVLTGFFNSTRVGLRGDELFVRHGPLPWAGNRVIDARTVTQLFTKEKVSNGRGGQQRSYELVAIVEGEKRVPLVSGLSEVEQALWLEQAFEERMGIVDVEVAGEV